MISIEESLCTNCGLCCDGSLFADVELASHREALKLEILGLEIDDTDRPVLVQPCPALKNKRCDIYQFRPNCCRTFECRLLRKVKAGAISLQTAQNQISHILSRIKTLKGQRSLEKTFLR
jgi:uncharacterized protein